jgi:hypothetical protein
MLNKAVTAKENRLFRNVLGVKNVHVLSGEGVFFKKPIEAFMCRPIK